MLLPHEIAVLEERRQARSVSELADEHLAVGGGAACYGGSPDSWMNRVIGAGMHGPVADAELDAMVRFYEERGVEPEIEVCPFADASLREGLAARGFVLRNFETVLARELADVGPAELPDGVRFEPLDPSNAAEVKAFVHTHLACFSPDGPPGKVEAMRVGAERMVTHERTRSFLVYADDELAGSGSFEALDELACLFAFGTLEPFRRRGIQRAFIDHRCHVARELGCTVATIGSRPDSPTGRNAYRAGFVTAYTKAGLKRRD